MNVRLLTGFAAGWLALAPGVARGASPLYADEEARLQPSAQSAGDHYGYAVAVSGDTALVGAYGVAALRGGAWISERTGATWSTPVPLSVADVVANDAFGSSVALSEDGDTALVGAPGQGSGAAYVFVRSGGAWVQEAKLSPADGVTGDRYGLSVAVSGDTAVVGAPERDARTGAVYVWTRSGTTWTAAPAFAGRLAGDRYGWSVAISGSTALVGAPFAEYAIGRAWLLDRSAGTWAEGQRLAAASGDEVTGAGFGLSVALDGDTAVLGANGIGGETGAAYVFARSGGSWALQQKLFAPDGVTGDNFGSVALCGDTAVIGAFHRDADRGAAYAFVRSGVTWTVLPTVLASDAASGDLAGETVACSGDTLLLGADGRDSSRGAAYVFRVVATQPAGGTCAKGQECASGYCADGACCAAECVGAVCAGDPDCPAGYTCVGAKCLLNTAGAACSPDKKKSVSSAGETACAPYVCVDSPGTCLSACADSTDCQSGYVCSGTSCVAKSKPTTGADSGCSASRRASSAPLGLALAACVALLGLALRNKR